ncbi:MAG: Putative SigmaB asociated two-component system sensor protein [Nitrospira sp.]|nr:MAG: Putative SigmaB asociated two-component system sensor protein [Nitrospira sp.]
MSYAIINVALKYEDDVVAARQRARQIAGLIGFDAQDQTRIATAVSEIARNAFRYARNGTVEFLIEGQTAPQVLLIRVTDSGPGIADLKRILEGRYQSDTGMGVGLIGAKRLMDQCEIDTAAGKGTRVLLKKVFPSRTRPLGGKELSGLVDQLIQTPAQNAQEELRQQNHELLRALEELRLRQNELVRMNQELEDTNRGVVALYAELDEKADHLRRADSMKTRFLSNMSHEFRTPLSSILALSGLLLDRSDGELTAEQDKQVRFVRKAAESLLELVNDLLDLAKIEAGKVDVRPVEFEVKTMFSALRGMLKPLLSGSSVNLFFEEAEDLPTLYTDEGKVSQILRNFISNALKFTERGEIRVTASVDAERRNIAIAVADTGIGIGIHPADQSRIFEEFTQLDSPIQRKVKGTGLGLPLCKKLAVLLGGQVTVESQVGVGSVFALAIPLYHEKALDNMLKPGDEAECELDPARLPVLIVEDHPETRLIYDKFLRNSRYQALLSGGLREARRLLHQIRPSAIVLDLLLCGEDSWQWLAHLKSDESTRDIPILIVTTVEDRGKAFMLGADAYQVKPIEASVLIAELDRLTKRPAHVHPPAPDRPRIMIIDDEESFRYILRKCLANIDCDVTESGDGMEGIRMCRELQPDLIFLDLNMPGRSGWQFLQDLTATEKLAGTPVVIVTSQSLSDDARTLLEQSTRGIVMKNELSEETINHVVGELIPDAFERHHGR